jgi:hypothetical protein
MDNIQPTKISIHDLQLITKLKKEYEEKKKQLIEEIYNEIMEELKIN